jgi:hypothetical protein
MLVNPTISLRCPMVPSFNSTNRAGFHGAGSHSSEGARRLHKRLRQGWERRWEIRRTATLLHVQSQRGMYRHVPPVFLPQHRCIPLLPSHPLSRWQLTSALSRCFRIPCRLVAFLIVVVAARVLSLSYPCPHGCSFQSYLHENLSAQLSETKLQGGGPHLFACTQGVKWGN